MLVSPHRTSRPWQGHEGDTTPALPEYEPKCYLCPGNDRAGGAVNPDYDGVFIFDNDFAALLDQTIDAHDDDPLFQVAPVRGRCRVICYGPRHNQPLHHMPHDEMVTVFNAWQQQSVELGQRYEWVQIFENRGALMGASSPHPHGQIWALDALPTEAARELERQSDYRRAHGRGLLQDYLARELAADERLVETSEHWVALVPFWAVWPFETLLLPRRPVARLGDLT
ncbi:MAG: galactose-1-phosphate uridylyltransferase, partial [Pseudomonadota bacterium]